MLQTKLSSIQHIVQKQLLLRRKSSNQLHSNMLYILVISCIIGLVVGDPLNPSNSSNPSTEKQAIEDAERSMASNNRIIDDLTPKLSFPETDLFSRFQYYYSAVTGRNVGDLKTSILNGQDSFFNAKQSIYNLCSGIVGIIDGYMQLLDAEDAKAAESRRSLLLHVINTEIQKLQESDANIKQTSSNVDASLTKLNDLLAQLKSEHSADDEFFKNFVKAAELEHSGNKTATARIANATLAAVKELISLGLMNPLIQKYLDLNHIILPPEEDFTGIFTIKLKAKFAEIEEFYENLKTKLAETKTQLDNTGPELAENIQRMQIAKTQVQNETIVDLPPEVVTTTKSAASKLIAKCESFRITATI